MNIKNIKGYARRLNFSGWTKYKLANACSYNDVKDAFKEEIEVVEFLMRNSPSVQHKFYEEKIQQVRNVLRLVGY